MTDYPIIHRWQTPNEIAPNEILHQTRSFSSILTCVLWIYDPITTYLWAWFVLIRFLWTHNMHFCSLITSHFFTIEVAKTPRSRLLQNSDLVVVFCTKRDPRFGWCLPPVNVSELFFCNHCLKLFSLRNSCTWTIIQDSSLGYLMTYISIPWFYKTCVKPCIRTIFWYQMHYSLTIARV